MYMAANDAMNRMCDSTFYLQYYEKNTLFMRKFMPDQLHRHTRFSCAFPVGSPHRIFGYYTIVPIQLWNPRLYQKHPTQNFCISYFPFITLILCFQRYHYIIFFRMTYIHVRAHSTRKSNSLLVALVGTHVSLVSHIVVSNHFTLSTSTRIVDILQVGNTRNWEFFYDYQRHERFSKHNLPDN